MDEQTDGQKYEQMDEQTDDKGWMDKKIYK
jgi:hypothetical protein